jgi:hypothetical protein
MSPDLNNKELLLKLLTSHNEVNTALQSTTVLRGNLRDISFIQTAVLF